jgi:dephospho-CoA kinase
LSESQIFVVGLVGGIASGKSHVARLMAERGAIVIDADRLGHDALNEPEIARRLARLFGPNIMGVDGTVQRSELASLVFGQDDLSTARRKQLEEVVHPEIRRAVIYTLRALQNSGANNQIVVIDAPLLLEAGWASLCDIIVFVETPRTLREQRARARGWSLQQFLDREAVQMSLDAKRQQSTHKIDGSASDHELEVAIGQLLEKIGPE